MAVARAKPSVPKSGGTPGGNFPADLLRRFADLLRDDYEFNERELVTILEAASRIGFVPTRRNLFNSLLISFKVPHLLSLSDALLNAGSVPVLFSLVLR
jgi:hypothetical protein